MVEALGYRARARLQVGDKDGKDGHWGPWRLAAAILVHSDDLKAIFNNLAAMASLPRGHGCRRLICSPIHKASQVSTPLAPMPNMYVWPSIMQRGASESHRADDPYLLWLLNDGYLQVGTGHK